MIDLDAVKSKWLMICGSCDAGIGECNHPSDDYRPVMLELVREIERLRTSVALLGDARVVYRIANRLADRCDRCGDTNYDEVTLACLTCTFPEAEAADADA
jgi:hypothetical protein